jgi:hypothetical protein
MNTGARPVSVIIGLYSPVAAMIKWVEGDRPRL